MPIGTTTAPERARAEANQWAEIAEHWTQAKVPELWAERPPTEKATIVFYDPSQDIARRAAEWGHELEGDDLSSLALFAAGLAAAEERGWNEGTPDIATRAYETRRFLLRDRIVFWATPWLDAVSRGYSHYRHQAHHDRDLLLRLGDEARIAPALPGSEGIFMEGEDSYGPVDPGDRWPRWTGSLWSGAVVFRMDRVSNLVSFYERTVETWAGFASEHPGSAQLWLDLSARARRTSARLRSRTM